MTKLVEDDPVFDAQAASLAVLMIEQEFGFKTLGYAGIDLTIDDLQNLIRKANVAITTLRGIKKNVGKRMSEIVKQPKVKS